MLLAGLNFVFIVLYFLSFGTWIGDALTFGGISTASILYIPPLILLVNTMLIARKKRIGWLLLHLWATAMMAVADYVLIDTFSALSHLSDDYSFWQFMHGSALWIMVQGAISLTVLILLQLPKAVVAFSIPRALRIGSIVLTITAILLTFCL